MKVRLIELFQAKTQKPTTKTTTLDCRPPNRNFDKHRSPGLFNSESTSQICCSASWSQEFCAKARLARSLHCCH